MRYHSTRDENEKLNASAAIIKGIATDGGLYIPEIIPEFTGVELEKLMRLDYMSIAEKVFGKFLEEFSSKEISEIVSAAYKSSFDSEEIAPLHIADDKTAYLELWHGPTCAFKDVALSALPHLMKYSAEKCDVDSEICILVATSGDTGKAALEGFADVKGTSILVFYPEKGVSEMQRLQMATQKGENVGVCAIKGNFDDAQTGVKQIFSDEELSSFLSSKDVMLSSANSINWGRLLPQIVYYFSAYRDFVKANLISFGDKLNFVVPTGNFGNILAGWYAGMMGLPIGKLICASNKNNVLTDFFISGKYNKNRQFYCTDSPSMDILVSSNLERLLYELSRSSEDVSLLMLSLSKEGEYEISDALHAKLLEKFFADFSDDDECREEIKRVWDNDKYLIDTHTAVASSVLRKYRINSGDNIPACIVSTASPYKFSGSVLAALSKANNEMSEFDKMKQLSKLTNTQIPKPLLGILDNELRFTDTAEISGMKAELLRFLGINEQE